MSIAKQNGANPIKRICVFCGVNRGAKPAYTEAAQALGLSLSKRGLGLVYGGTRLGMMGAIADAVLAQGGEVIGVIPEFLTPIAHEKLTQLHVANGQEVVIFHSALGLRPAVLSFAARLREAGYGVHTPDLYDGAIFMNAASAVAKIQELGFDELIARSQAAVTLLPSDLVYARSRNANLPAGNNKES